MVKKGDTLYEIAKKNGTTVEQLMQLNPGITNPDVIDVGMKVKVPGGGVKPNSPSGDWMHQHVVKQGDTLWKLSKAWGIPLADMIQANPQLKNPNALLTGEVVNIPKAASAPFTPLTLPELPDLQHMPHGFPANPGHGKTYTGPIEGKAPTAPVTPAPAPFPAPPKAAETAPMPVPAPHEAMPFDIDLFKQFQIPAAEAFTFCDFPPPPQMTVPSAHDCPPPMPAAAPVPAAAWLTGMTLPMTHQMPVMHGYPCPPGTIPVADWAGALPQTAPQAYPPFAPQAGVTAGGYGSFTGHADVTAGLQGYGAMPPAFGAASVLPAMQPGHDAGGLFGPGGLFGGPALPYYGAGSAVGGIPAQAYTAGMSPAYPYPMFGAYPSAMGMDQKPCACGCSKREEAENGANGGDTGGDTGGDADEAVKTGVRAQTAKASSVKKPAAKASVKSSASRPSARKAQAARRFGRPWLNR